MGDGLDTATRHQSTHLPSLTGLRWVAAFLVFGYHLHVVEFFAPGMVSGALGALFGAGSVGVSFFFILSGFVLMWTYSPSTRRRFWWRRVARVYPLHAVTAVLALAFLFLRGPGGVPSSSVVAANLALLQSWFPTVDYYQSLNTVSWTLSCEAFFYFAFPFLAAAMSRARLRASLVVIVGSWVVTAGGPVAARLIMSGDSVDWFFHWNPLGRIPEFVFGIAVARLVRLVHSRGTPPLHTLWCVTAGLTLAGYGAASVAPDPFGYAACTMPGFGLLLLTAACADSGRRWTPWQNGTTIRLGELSYAFYLVHLLVIRVVETLVGFHPRLDDGRAAVLTMLTFLAALIGAWVLHTGCERPARTLLLRHARAEVSAAERPSGCDTGGEGTNPYRST